MPAGRPRLVQTEKACPGEALPCGGSSTALKWGCDGELSELDRDRILRRLAAADPVAQNLHHQSLLQRERHQRSA